MNERDQKTPLTLLAPLFTQAIKQKQKQVANMNEIGLLFPQYDSPNSLARKIRTLGL